VFGLVNQGQGQHLVLIETKGRIWAATRTRLKAALLQRLQQAFRDERWTSVGELALTDAADRTVLSCDLLMDAHWAGTLEARWFHGGRPRRMRAHVSRSVPEPGPQWR
jgi:type III restriction enzyme